MDSIKSALWQGLSARMKVNYTPARPMPFPRKFHTSILLLGFAMLSLFILWSGEGACLWRAEGATAATTGYDMISTYDQNFNQTDTKEWFEEFAPYAYNKNRSGICEPKLLNIGDTFQTGAGVWQYTIENYYFENSTALGGHYYKTDLGTCDCYSIAIHLNMDDLSLSADLTTLCQEPWPAYSTVTYTTALDPTMQTTSAKKGSKLTQEAQLTAYAVILTLDNLSADLIQRGQAIIQRNTSSPLRYSFLYYMALPLSDRPDFDLTETYQSYATYKDNIDSSDDGDTSLELVSVNSDHGFDVPIQNLLTALLGSIRLDFGTNSTNNVFNNKTALYTWIKPSGDITNDTGIATTLSGADLLLNASAALQDDLPYAQANRSYVPQYIDTLYLCNVPKVKGIYSWTNSVLGIAWSNFSSSWVIIMMMLGILAKYKYPEPVRAPPGGPRGAPPGGVRGAPPPPPPPPATTTMTSAGMRVGALTMKHMGSSLEKMGEELEDVGDDVRDFVEDLV